MEALENLIPEEPKVTETDLIPMTQQEIDHNVKLHALKNFEAKYKMKNPNASNREVQRRIIKEAKKLGI